MMSEQCISKNKKEIGVLIQLVIQQEGLWRDSEWASPKHTASMQIILSWR